MGEVNERQGKHALIVHGVGYISMSLIIKSKFEFPESSFLPLLYFNMPSIYYIFDISIAVIVTPSENSPHSPAGTQEDPIFMMPLENPPLYHSGTREDPIFITEHPRSGTEQNPIYIHDDPNSGE
jgi:hypothetical protein